MDLLVVSFDLNYDLFMPYLKPNNVIMYVNVNSNHPPKIKENIPESINKRLSTLSKNENVFQEAKGPYQDALENAGYKFRLKFNPPKPPSNSRPRKRNITWYNPPYCKSVKTSLAKEFFKDISIMLSKRECPE